MLRLVVLDLRVGKVLNDNGARALPATQKSTQQKKDRSGLAVLDINLRQLQSHSTPASLRQEPHESPESKPWLPRLMAAAR